MTSISKIKGLGKEFPFRGAAKEIIAEDSDGQRIDNFLIKRLKAVPKSHIYQLLRSGQVRINSKRVEAGHHLHLGDIVRIPPLKMAEGNSLRTENRSTATGKAGTFRQMRFEVLFEDASLLVINKPPGVAVHGGSGISRGVIEQLRAEHPEWKFLELVHRLDRETSGVLLLAKTRSALVELHRQIREGTMKKQYLTLVKGKWQNVKQSVKLPLNKFVTSAGERRVAVASGTGVEKAMAAHTVFVLNRRWRDFSLLQAELKTGRTHQIRVHLAHLGFPIAGDDKYGDFALNKQLARRTVEPSLQRMFLHAGIAEVAHPVTGEQLRLEATLSDDLREFVKALDSEDTPR